MTERCGHGSRAIAMPRERCVLRRLRKRTRSEIGRERKHLVEQRTRIVGRIKGLLALHGVHIAAKGIGKSLGARLDGMLTGDGRPLPPFLRREIERMLRHHAFLSAQIAEVEADRGQALTDAEAGFPFAEKVRHWRRWEGSGRSRRRCWSRRSTTVRSRADGI